MTGRQDSLFLLVGQVMFKLRHSNSSCLGRHLHVSRNPFSETSPLGLAIGYETEAVCDMSGRMGKGQ